MYPRVSYELNFHRNNLTFKRKRTNKKLGNCIVVFNPPLPKGNENYF